MKTLDPDTLTTAADALLSRGFAKIVMLTSAAVSSTFAAIQTDAISHATQPSAELVIAADSTLRLWCLTGSLLGALVRVSVRPPKNLAGFARSFIVSLAFGVMAAPLIVRRFVEKPDADYMLAVSGALAFLGWLSVEAIEKAGAKWLKTKAGEI
jgi:peptidoglycan/LPS O-acetylase OafA/YrhL